MSDWFGGSNSSPVQTLGAGVEIRPLMRTVYLWMTLGLLVTGFVALFVSNSPSILELALNRGVFFGAIIAELALVWGISLGINRLSPGLAIVLFFVYAAINGFTLSLIFIVYDLGTISTAFFTTAAAFGAMTVLGYTTGLDLSQYRSYFIMGLVGLIVAMLVNMFLQSSTFDLIISIFGVFLFLALTAYDTQKIKRLAADPVLTSNGEMMMKVSILGALTLYLDFINLFLFLLRLFGRRR